VTDHRLLTWTFSKDPSSSILRWRLKLEYEYEVVYEKGSSNTNDDALSRNHLTEDHTDDHEIEVGPTKEEKQAFSGITRKTSPSPRYEWNI